MPARGEEELASLRSEIADLDRRLLEVVARRLETTRRVGEVKRREGLPIRDFRVEVDVLGRARQRAEDLGLDRDLAEELMRRLIAAAVETQRGLLETGHRAGDLLEVLVVGGAGRMGSWLARFFAVQGHRVAVSDPAAGDPFPHVPLEEAVPVSQVVALATPLGKTPEILEQVLALGGDPLVFDICSLKGQVAPLLRAAAARGRRVTSLHPMFAPGATLLSGRALLVCDAGNPEATESARRLFSDTALGLFDVPLEEHDRLMGCLLNMSHALNLQFALALARSGVPFQLLGRIASTTFARQIATTAEVTGENPRLYHEIQHYNGHTPEVMALLEGALTDLRDAAAAPDPASFEALMAEAAGYLGPRTGRGDA